MWCCKGPCGTCDHIGGTAAEAQRYSAHMAKMRQTCRDLQRERSGVGGYQRRSAKWCVTGLCKEGTAMGKRPQDLVICLTLQTPNISRLKHTTSFERPSGSSKKVVAHHADRLGNTAAGEPLQSVVLTVADETPQISSMVSSNQITSRCRRSGPCWKVQTRSPRARVWRTAVAVGCKSTQREGADFS